MIKHLVSTSSFVVLITGVALAQAPSTPPKAPEGKAAGGMPSGPPAPAAELDEFMKGFVGTWKCQTKMEAGSMGPGSPALTLPSTVKFKKDLNGFFYVGEYDMKKSKTFPGMRGVIYIGYDTGARKFTLVGVDSMGGVAMESGAVEGDQLIATGETTMMGQKMKVREVMGMKGAKQAIHKFEMDMGKGLVPMGEDDCKK
jgi:Protein of unknown function (DUF1579)